MHSVLKFKNAMSPWLIIYNPARCDLKNESLLMILKTKLCCERPGGLVQNEISAKSRKYHSGPTETLTSPPTVRANKKPPAITFLI